MLFSIIIAVYNKQEYIAETIESIVGQSYENYELILIDDGSSDDSYKICCDYAKNNNKIKVLHHENQGVSITRNQGLKAAKGEYIFFVDADDLLAANALQELEIILKKEENPDVIMFGMTESYKDGTKCVLCPKFCGKYDRYGFLKDFHQRNKKGVYGYVANKVFRRKIAIENNIEFCKKYKLSEDFYFFLQIYNESNYFVVVDDQFYIYQKDIENALTNYKRINYMHVIEIYDFCQRVLKQCGHEEEVPYIFEIISHQIFYMIQDMVLDLKNADINQINQIMQNEHIRNEIIICKDSILESVCLVLVKTKKLRILKIIIFILRSIRKGVKRV